MPRQVEIGVVRVKLTKYQNIYHELGSISSFPLICLKSANVFVDFNQELLAKSPKMDLSAQKRFLCLLI